MPAKPKTAVEVRDAMKSYVEGTIVLNKMNMTVPKGAIYGLLGSSGCGKSTILNSIVGLSRLDSGKIRIYGRPALEMQRSSLGYMPQSLALYPNFTITETFLYFGRILGMESSEILLQVEFLTTFLKLPDSSKRISSLSGGESRRVSFGLAILNACEADRLMILDEPTVGLDPILRANIWDYLIQLVKNGRNSIIVTTHYIEEVRRSDMIGLMRNGRLIAEDSPETLLRMFNAPLLEDIVLELCRKDQEKTLAAFIHHHDKHYHNDTNHNKNVNQNQNNQLQVPTHHIHLESGSPKPTCKFITCSRKFPKYATTDFIAESQNCDCVVVRFGDVDTEKKVSDDFAESDNGCVVHRRGSCPTSPTSSTPYQRINSLVRRNCIFFMRNIWFVAILLIYPAIQTALVASTIGGDPKHMRVAVVNNEILDWRTDCKTENLTCGSGQYSCRFLKRLENDNLKLEQFYTMDEALEEINSGTLYGILNIPANYTQHIIDRKLVGNFAENETLDGTMIGVRLDFSNFVASWLIIRQLYNSLESYAMELGGQCGKLPQEFEIPLKYRTPIYGRLESKYTEYVVPGALVIILFLIPLATCGLAWVADKRQGTMDRSMAAGVTSIEIMIASFVTDGVAIILQTIISTAIMVYGFDFTVEGSYIIYGMLCFLTGMCGQSVGFVLGVMCSDEAGVLTSGFFLHIPMLMAAGIVWPLEGVSLFFRYLCHSLPVTASLHSMRSIIARGVGLTNDKVWPGFVILICWTTLAWIIALVKYKSIKK